MAIVKTRKQWAAVIWIDYGRSVDAVIKMDRHLIAAKKALH